MDINFGTPVYSHLLDAETPSFIQVDGTTFDWIEADGSYQDFGGQTLYVEPNASGVAGEGSYIELP
jgi:hypothetical protein